MNHQDEQQPIKPGQRITWLAHLGGRGDYYFPIPGIALIVTAKHIKIAVQAYGGRIINRIVGTNRVVRGPD